MPGPVSAALTQTVALDARLANSRSAYVPLKAPALNGPQTSYSYYITSDNLDACSGNQTWSCPIWTMGAATVVPAGGSMAILDFGAPCQDPSNNVITGVQMFGLTACVDDSTIRHLLSRWISGYEATHPAGTPRTIVAAGLSNAVNGIPGDMQTPEELAWLGKLWSIRVVHATSVRNLHAPLTVWGAIDAEQSGGGDWLGPTETKAFVDAYGVQSGHRTGSFPCNANTPGMLADFGDAVYLPGVLDPPDGWTPADIYHVAWGAAVACAVPEIYYDINAQEWQALSHWGAVYKHAPIVFTAAMSEDGAEGTESASQSWSSLARWTGQHVPFNTTVAWDVVASPARIAALQRLVASGHLQKSCNTSGGRISACA